MDGGGIVRCTKVLVEDLFVGGPRRRCIMRVRVLLQIIADDDTARGAVTVTPPEKAAGRP